MRMGVWQCAKLPFPRQRETRTHESALLVLTKRLFRNNSVTFPCDVPRAHTLQTRRPGLARNSVLRKKMHPSCVSDVRNDFALLTINSVNLGRTGAPESGARLSLAMEVGWNNFLATEPRPAPKSSASRKWRASPRSRANFATLRRRLASLSGGCFPCARIKFPFHEFRCPPTARLLSSLVGRPIY